MQILPDTAEEYLADRKLWPDLTPAQFAALSADPARSLHRPDVALRVGLAYASELLEQFNGNLTLALAAYNAGPGNVRKHHGVPHWRETEQYVKLVPRYAAEIDRIIT
jgi:soluble lytic murein transglycosylase-like protein